MSAAVKALRKSAEKTPDRAGRKFINQVQVPSGAIEPDAERGGEGGEGSPTMATTFITLKMLTAVTDYKKNYVYRL